MTLCALLKPGCGECQGKHSPHLSCFTPPFRTFRFLSQKCLPTQCIIENFTQKNGIAVSGNDMKRGGRKVGLCNNSPLPILIHNFTSCCRLAEVLLCWITPSLLFCVLFCNTHVVTYYIQKSREGAYHLRKSTIRFTSYRL